LYRLQLIEVENIFIMLLVSYILIQHVFFTSIIVLVNYIMMTKNGVKQSFYSYANDVMRTAIKLNYICQSI